MAAVKAKPDGYPTLTPYLCVDGAAQAIEFYRDVFGATERMRMPAPGGKIGHAELNIGDSLLMLADEFPDMGVLGPKRIGGSPVTLSIYVDDVDAVCARGVERGATQEHPVQDQFYGDRTGMFIDPFGHRWNIATHVEDVSPDEMQRRAAAAMGAASS